MKRPRVTYDPLTGTFTRDGQPLPVRFNGAGLPTLAIKGTRVMAARLAWALHTGVPPRYNQVVTFADDDKANIRFANLRCVSLNAIRHRQKTPRHNTSGHRNVQWSKTEQKWRVRIKSKGVCYYIGAYPDIADAVNAAAQARKSLHNLTHL